jgi:hypothetical protein
MRSRIKIADLRDRIKLYSLTLYNDATTGVPKATYSGTGTDLYAMVRRAIGSDPTGDDKTKVVSNYEITIRIDSTVIKVEDKIVWDSRNMIIKDIQQIDIWYQKLICYNEY